MKTEKKNEIITVITTEGGKVFRRISDGQIFGSELYLGYTHYLNSEKLEKPLLELPEHYEEVDEPVTRESIVLDGQTSLAKESPDKETEITDKPLQKVTLEDYRKLEETVRNLQRKLGL